MRWADYGGRVFESMGAVFLVTPVDEFEPSPGDLVQVQTSDVEFDDSSSAVRGARWEWFVVLEKFEDEGVEWFSIRRASLWERLFGGRDEQARSTH